MFSTAKLEVSLKLVFLSNKPKNVFYVKFYSKSIYMFHI